MDDWPALQWPSFELRDVSFFLFLRSLDFEVVHKLRFTSYSQHSKCSVLAYLFRFEIRVKLFLTVSKYTGVVRAVSPPPPRKVIASFHSLYLWEIFHKAPMILVLFLPYESPDTRYLDRPL